MNFKVNTTITPATEEIIVLQQLIHSYNHLAKLVILPHSHIMHYEMIEDKLVNIYMIIDGKRNFFYPSLSNRLLIEQVVIQTRALLCLL